MKGTLDFGEEIREHLHPTFKDLKVTTVVPDDLQLASIADRLQAIPEGDTKKAIEVGREVLAEILREVSGPTPKKDGQVFTPSAEEWATELSRAKYEFRRSDPIPVVILDNVVQHPVTGLALTPEEYRPWQDPRTLRSYTVLWDAEKDEPKRQEHRVKFSQHIIESILFNASDDTPGKGSPTLSADQ